MGKIDNLYYDLETIINNNNNKYGEYMNKLTKWLDSKRSDPDIEGMLDKCCDKMKLRKGLEYRVCVSCGRCNGKSREDTEYYEVLNARYQNTTTIGYAKNSKKLHRLHKWTNYDYRENMAMKNYKTIRDMCEDFGLHNRVKDNACFIYKRIYIDKMVSSRHKIKECIFMYCILHSCNDYKINFDIISNLRKYNLNINKYNKALLKIEDDDVLFLNKNMESYYNLIIHNFHDKKIKMSDIIILYNILYKKSKNNTYKLNNNSILLGCIYFLLSEDKRFYRVFNITYTTINKIKKKFIK